MRPSAGDVPLLVLQTLRGDDGVDGTTFSCLLQLALRKEETEKEKEKDKGEKGQAKVKRTLRRFFGCVFVLPDAQGRCGFTQTR